MSAPFPFETERHRDETAPSSVHPTDFYSTTDPALDPDNDVAAGKRWRKTNDLTTPTWFEVYVRNEANGAWILERAWVNDTYSVGEVPVADANGRLAPGTVSGGSTVDIEDEGAAEGAADTIDFVGSGVSVTFAAGTATVNIPGAGTATIAVEDEGAPEGAADTIDFVGAGVSVSFAGGVATVDIPGGGGIDLEDEGTPEGTAIDTIDFVGANVTVVDDGGGHATVTISGGGGGGLVLLDTQTASASAALTFAGNITSTYDRYEIHFNDLVPGTDNVQLNLAVSHDNGSTWASAAYFYANGIHTDGGFVGAEQNASTSIIKVAGDCGSGTGEQISGTIILHNPLSALYKSIRSDSVQLNQSSATGVNYRGVSGIKVTTPVDAVRLIMASGTIATGVARLYGVEK